jgi:hypothetical protein
MSKSNSILGKIELSGKKVTVVLFLEEVHRALVQVLIVLQCQQLFLYSRSYSDDRFAITSYFYPMSNQKELLITEEPTLRSPEILYALPPIFPPA